MLALHDLQLCLHAVLPEDGADEEGDEPGESVLKVLRGHVEVEVSVLGRRVRVGTAAAAAYMVQYSGNIGLTLDSRNRICGWET